MGSHGFVFPAIGVAEALARRGHDVAFATGQDFCKTLELAGFQRLPRTERDGRSFQITCWGNPDEVALQVKHLEYALERFDADIILTSDFGLGPLIVAERYEIPVAILGLSTFPWPSLLPGARRRFTDEIRHRDIYHLTDRTRLYNRARTAMKLPEVGVDPLATPLLGDRYLLRSVSELTPDFESYPPHVLLVGDCLNEPLGAEGDLAILGFLDAWKKRGGPLLYVQHGRHFDVPYFWPALREALAERSVSVIAALGRMENIGIGDLPDRFFVRPHVSQSLVLEHAEAVVASGTTTVVLGALRAGRPMLLIPAGGEQPYLAECAREAGVARVISPYDVDPETIGTAVECLIADEALGKRAREIQPALLAVSGPELAATAVESLARSVSVG